MTLLERHLKRKREKREHLQQFLDSCAKAENWCRRCGWKNTGSPCVWPRCFGGPSKRKEDTSDKEAV